MNTSKRGKDNGWQAPLTRPVVHFSIKTSCFLYVDSARFTVLVSIRSWTTLDVQLINRIISLGRWCNVWFRCNERERDLEIFHLWLEMERERWNYYETWRFDEREDKIWCRWGWGICNCWKKLRGSPDLSWTKNSYFAFSRVMQDFLVPLVRVWKERARRLDNERHAFFLFSFFFFLFSVPTSNGNCSFLLTRFSYSLERIVYKKNESMKLGDWIFLKWNLGEGYELNEFQLFNSWINNTQYFISKLWIFEDLPSENYFSLKLKKDNNLFINNIQILFFNYRDTFLSKIKFQFEDYKVFFNFTILLRKKNLPKS